MIKCVIPGCISYQEKNGLYLDIKFLSYRTALLRVLPKEEMEGRISKQFTVYTQINVNSEYFGLQDTQVSECMQMLKIKKILY